VILQLNVESQYTPGCVTIVFGNPSDTQIVYTEEGHDMAKLQDCHLVYKEVIHGCIGAEEAIARLDWTKSQTESLYAVHGYRFSSTVSPAPRLIPVFYIVQSVRPEPRTGLD